LVPVSGPWTALLGHPAIRLSNPAGAARADG
jgi:hypothetical protein